MMSPEQLERLIRQSVISIRAGGNLVVLHTLPGTAQGVAYAIDSIKWVGVMGTVAGDDTIFVAIERPEFAEEFSAYFQWGKKGIHNPGKAKRGSKKKSTPVKKPVKTVREQENSETSHKG